MGGKVRIGGSILGVLTNTDNKNIQGFVTALATNHNPNANKPSSQRIQILMFLVERSEVRPVVDQMTDFNGKINAKGAETKVLIVDKGGGNIFNSSADPPHETIK